MTHARLAHRDSSKETSRVSDDSIERLASRWIDAINRCDIEELCALAAPQHRFFVEGEEPTVGRDRIRSAWQGYFEAYPMYRIYVDERYEKPNALYLIGHTTGSHIPTDREEMRSSVIWRCEIAGDKILEWSIYPATSTHRKRFGIEGRDGDPHSRL